METIEEGMRNVVTASEIWVVDKKLHWPPSNVSVKRKNHTPPEDGWKVYDCKILKTYGKL